MLLDSQLSAKWWAHAMATATHTINLFPSAQTPSKVPEEETGRGKLDPQGEKVVMLGYNRHGVYLTKPWDSDKVLRVRDVVWLKDGGHWVENDNRDIQEDLLFLEFEDNKHTQEEIWGTKATRHTTRDPVPSRRTLDAMNSELPSVPEPDNDWVPDTYKEAATRLDLWGPAMEKELKKIDDRKVFTPMPRPPNTPTVMLKWHYTLQKDGEGRIMERWARLVVRGFTQVKGVHYEDTWAMVARYESLQFVIAIAAYYGLNLWSGDFTAAYLNAKPQGVNYLNLPPGYESRYNLWDGAETVLHMDINIYGTKDVGNNWF
ncbi:retrovirus-related pol polyprotein [Moniliophthora roreri MCA 2997]|uniref:Retrovirus-related pol polyprotein n=2 Tax=Moniliophthora roreri TaxID=221103 RepID=V2X1S8_MONRO|nr:retrovirus-related pol polyprotein [Moniliophthora roreri MCA 2997]